MRFGSLTKLEELSRTDESPSKMLHDNTDNFIEDEILNGAQSREKNFRLQLNDQYIFQEQQRNRANTQESCQAAPLTPESINIQNANVFPTAANNGNLIFNTSPSQPILAFGDMVQHHKNSIATVTTTTNKNEVINMSNNFYNMKSTNSQTPQTLKRHKDSNHFTSGLKSEDDNMKSLKYLSNEFDSDVRRNNIQSINLRKNSSFSQSNNNFLNNPSTNQMNNNIVNPENYKFTIANHINCIVSQPYATEKGQSSMTNIAPIINMKKCQSTNNNEGGTEETDSQPYKGDNTSKARGVSKASQNQRKSRFSGVLGSPSMKGFKGVNSSSDILKNLNIMKHARQFMHKLLNFTLQSHYKYLKQKHYDLIGDSASFYNADEHLYINEIEKQSNILKKSGKSLKSFSSGLAHRSTLSQKSYFSNKRKELNKFIGIFCEVIKRVPVFDPESVFFIVWDLIMLIFQVIIFLLVPLSVSFELEWHIPGIEITGISTIAGGFFLLDAILTLNRGVYVSGVAVLDRSVIVKNYLKNILFTDFVTLIAISNFNTYAQLLILIRIYYIKVLIFRLDDHFSLRMRFPDTMQLAQMIASTIMIAHLCACGFHLVSRLSYEIGGENVALVKEYYSDSWYDKYIACLYFAFITMSTVGYGDVVPKNNYERCYVMVMTMLSSALFGYVINTIGSIYTNMAQRRAIFEQRKFDIMTYMSNRNIPKHMQMRTIKYLEYTQFQKDETHIKGQAIIDQLPSQLSAEIKQEFFGKILHGNKLFNSHFSSQVINQMEGCVSIYVHCQNGVQKKIATIDEKNFMIGQRSFFCQQVRTKWVKCEKTSNFAYCDLKDFKEILLNYPLEYEIFCEIRDSILFEEKSADTSCASCDKFSHTFSNCPLIHLKLNKSKIIYSHSYSEPQVRQKGDSLNQIPQRRKKLYQAYRDRQLLRQHLKQVRIECVKEQLMNEQNDDITFQNGTSSMTRFLVHEEIKSYEQLNYTTVDDKQFYLNVPEITPLLPLTQIEEQYLCNDQYRQMLTTENDEEEDDQEDDIEDYCSSQEKNENTQEIFDINNDKQSEKIPQIPSYSHISEKTPISSMNNNIISSSKIELLNHSKENSKQNLFSKAIAAFEDSTSDLRKNIQSTQQLKNQQEDQVQFNILPRHNSETSIHSSLKEPQTFQYTKQQSSQSVKFSQNQVYGNQPILKDSQQQSNQQQQILPQSLNEQLIRLINQALQQNQQQQQNNNNNNSNNNNLLQGQSTNSLTIQQPVSSSVRRPSFQRVKSRKGTHKKSVSIMKQKTLKLSNQQTSGLIQNTLLGENHQSDIHSKQKQQQFYQFDFEKVKNMSRYFPKYNMQNVVLVQNKYYKLRMNSLRKSQRREVGENRSTTMIGRNSVIGHSPTRRRKDPRTATIMPPPFQLRTKKIKQTVIIQS